MSVEEQVKKIIMEQLGVTAEEVKPEASFVEDLGADSLDLPFALTSPTPKRSRRSSKNASRIRSSWTCWSTTRASPKMA